MPASPPLSPFVSRLVIFCFGFFALSLVGGLISGLTSGQHDDGTTTLIIVASLLVVAGVVFGIRALVRKRRDRSRFIDAKLAWLLGGLEGTRAYSKTLPRFRFVDLHRAVVSHAQPKEGWAKVETTQVEPLSMILNRRFYQLTNRRMTRSERSARKVGPGQEEFFSVDTFWILPVAAATLAKKSPTVIRVRQGPMPHECTLEIASGTAREGTALVEHLVKLAAAQSIYRNHLLDLEFAGEIRDSDGNIEQNENFDLVFKPSPDIGPDDIVMDDEVARALDRNVLDFHRRRDALAALGLPSRRGVLLYGPPGTGKTYTCKYLASQLSGTITTLVASGESLLRVRTLCNLARMLQPALIVLEDVDLVYAARESGAGHNASLGKLMDELDGFGRDDRIIFILTTNAIDRVERAVSDRPGRISQCVFLGPPSDPLRRRYLRRQLRPYDAGTVNLDGLAAQTEGTTQAFLKELVFRAVQIGSLDAPPPPSPSGGQDPASPPAARLTLLDEHFESAMREMRATGGRAGEAIIGFRAVGF